MFCGQIAATATVFVVVVAIIVAAVASVSDIAAVHATAVMAVVWKERQHALRGWCDDAVPQKLLLQTLGSGRSYRGGRVEHIIAC
jgi:hypothetical protein